MTERDLQTYADTHTHTYRIFYILGGDKIKPRTEKNEESCYFRCAMEKPLIR